MPNEVKPIDVRRVKHTDSEGTDEVRIEFTRDYCTIELLIDGCGVLTLAPEHAIEMARVIINMASDRGLLK